MKTEFYQMANPIGSHLWKKSIKAASCKANFFPFRHLIGATLRGRQLLQTLLLFVSMTFTSFALTAQTATTTTVTSSNNPSTLGTAVTFTSSSLYSNFISNSPVPEGTVTFMDGADMLVANVPVTGAGVATFTTSSLTAGSHVIAAIYNGTATYAASTASIHQTVDGTDPCPSYVNNTAYVNETASPGTNDGTSWATAFLTLQAALDAARTCGVTQIWVAQGAYQPTNFPIGASTSGMLSTSDYSFHLVDGVAIYGGFSGNGTETNLGQRNVVLNPTILNGNNTYYHVVVSANDGPATRLDGFTITGGNSNGSRSITVEGRSFGETTGGAVTAFNSSFIFTNLVIRSNNATSVGGISMFNGSPTLTNVAVIGHTTGGMSYVSAGTGFVVSLTNCVFAGNSGNGGGGLQLNGFGLTSNLANVVFYNNTAARGGGLLNAAGTTNLTNCSFISNSASSSGGAMYNVNGATVNDKNGIYYNNNSGNTAYNGVFNFSIDTFNPTTTFSGDPVLVNIADPDGPDNIWMTADDGLSIQSTSPAINAGTLAGAPSTDIRGFARTGNPDQGAYEYGVNSTITTTGTLTPFATCAGTVSVEQTFTVTGTSLTANLSVGGPAGFEVSLTSGSGFATSVSITPIGGAVPTTTIFVRMASASSGSPSGNIMCSSTGATQQNLAVSGSFDPVPTGIVPSVAAICSGNFADIPLSITTLPSIPSSITGLYFTWSVGTITGGITGAVDGTSSVTGLYEGVPIHQLLANPGTTQGSVRYNITPVLTYSPSLVCAGQLYMVTVPVNALPSAAISGSTTICSGSPTNLSIQFTGTAPFTYRINGTDPVIATNNPEIIPVSPGTAQGYTVTSLSDANCNANSAGIAGTATITVNPLPSATIDGTTAVCQNTAQPNIIFTGSGGTAPYRFTYNLFDGTNTATGLVISGSPSASLPVSTGTVGIFTYTLTSVQDASTTACSQNIPGQTASITVNPLPSATISGATTVCQNAAQPNVTFTGSGGAASYTFAYSVSDGTTTTTGAASGSPSAIVSVPTGVAGTFTYTLLSVQDGSSTSCAQTISGQTAAVTVNALPDATITAASPVTSVSTGNTASVADAGFGSTYSWTVANGYLTGGNGTHSITYTAGVSGFVSIFVSVTSGSSCGPVTSTQQVTITPQACPNASITLASAVCTLSTGNIASVPNAGTGTTYVWTITNGTITGGSGTRSITYTAGVPGFVSLSVKVTNSSKVCTVSSGTYRVCVSPLPVAFISVPTSVCSSSIGNIASVPTCGTGATYVWTITNGTITAGSGTSKITYAAGVLGSISLSVTATNTTGCKAFGNKVVTIVAYPIATITAASSVCAGSNGNKASVTSAGTGARYSWTITNGVITGGSSTNSITWSACASGSVTLAVKVTNSGGCSASSGNKVVTINAASNAAITASSSICAVSTNTASVASGAASYSWTITNGTISGSTSASSISYKAGTSGTVKLTVTVTNSGGCKSSGTKSVTIVAAPNATITTTSAVCSGSTGNTASVAGAGSGATYTWTISNGSITSGGRASSVKYTAAASGFVTWNVTVKNSAGCTSAGGKSVTINSKVTPTFAKIATLCLNAKAPTLPATSTNGIPGSWSPSKVTTSSTGTKTYTFTPASGQCALSATMSITVQKCNTLSLASGMQPVTEAAILEAKVVPNPTETEFTLTLTGNSNKPVEVRVVDMYGRYIHHARGSANQSYKFGQQFTSGVYIVEILEGKLVKSIKLIKAK